MANSQPLRVLGLDIASRNWSTNGVALLTCTDSAEWANVQVQLGRDDWPHTPMTVAAMVAWLLEQIDHHQIDAIAMDGPIAWRDPQAGERPGVGRASEYALKTPGKTGPPGKVYPANYRGWVEFCIAVVDGLLDSGRVALINDPMAIPPRDGSGRQTGLMEVFPTAVWRSCGLAPLAGHAKVGPQDLADARQRLQARLGIQSVQIHRCQHDDLQAWVAALPAMGLLARMGQLAPLGQARAWGEPARDSDWEGRRIRIEGFIWDLLLDQRLA
ncbi:DUF429 domain-containing protein [Tuwongella immobilis]|uniref:DUF429 domain-containing protein n=1 Tax=Tuwongella immobilis TaxID=692036 RepID=A0A6C2YQQ8_9BACT|nr:DUF429 domain-containing protein [Tuwongella immobilis]VIP03433.1 Uncharacterized protein OS=Anaeromyxobacter dehalogenans (strain 2CP-1 / ATCC BAA-258) GN=A2cp1_0590 PE=4 SV=1 [Tuwongella immobilis]VTS04238.1 Uncharacterized protein OS=Anaeromyxobacter dehalogenans (strain 2CP-1 / ATCC BAA-258) GN=A2cp1_0590 PE=4 SV=1 [Tuwongella immobilis]